MAEEDPIGSIRAERLPLASTLLGGLRDPVIVILVLAGTFDWLSGNPIHSILLLAAAFALARDASIRRRAEFAKAAGGPGLAGGHAPGGAETGARAVPFRAAFGDLSPRAVVIGAAAFAVIVGWFQRYSWPATATVVGVAAAGLALGWEEPPREASGPVPLRASGVLAWASVFVGLALWELATLLLQPSLTTDSYAHPTLSVVTDPILATRPGRSIILFLWLMFGWFLVQR